MERYEKYKDSGVEWIGEIPEGWWVKKIKHRCYVKGRVGWKGLKSNEFLIDGFSYLVTGTDFKEGKVYWRGCYHIDKERYEEDPFIQLQDDDLLITKDGTIGKLAIVDNLDKPACLNSGIFVVRSLNDDFTTRYLYWMLTSDVFTKFNEYTSYGSTIQHLYQNVFVEFAFSFPTRKVQTVIANYLDRKTAEIDELIAQKERLLKLYEEEKTAIINQAVTKGIDPDVKLKDSGIEWPGEIPEGWEIKKLKNESYRIGDGIHTTPNYLSGTGVFFINGVNLSNGRIVITEKTMSVPFEEYEKYKLELRPGSILISLNGTIGKLAVFNGEKVVLGKSAAFIELKNKINNLFLYYVMQSKYVANYFEGSFSGTTIKNLSLYTLRNTHIPTPLINEQKFIVEYIETETTRINAKIAITKRIIELQKEYRTALISEVVTGKIKVRQEAAS